METITPAKVRQALEAEIAVQNKKMGHPSEPVSSAFMHSEMKAMLTRILSRLDNAQAAE